MRPAELTGDRFGSLRVMRRTKSNADGRAIWVCLCDCGAETVVNTRDLRTGRTRSCGCAKGRPPVPESDRLWSRIDRRGPNECWPWRGRLDSDGYGRICRAAGGHTGAHRLAYVLTVGPIPEGLVIDHLCRNRPCCNPAHMEPVTSVENVLRGFSARKAALTGDGQTREGEEA